MPDGGPGAAQFGALMDKLIRLTVSAWAVCVVLVAGAAVTEPAEPIGDQLWTKTPVFTAENLQTDCSAMDTGYGSGEDPNEGEYITEALVAQGYFREDLPLTYQEQDFLQSACEEFGVEYPLMLALIERETRFQNVAGDGGDSMGYCQIQERWWGWLMAEIGAEDLTDPQDNFRTGCAIMSYLSGKYGNTRDALSAYNTGSPGKTEYASAVLEAAENWR